MNYQISILIFILSTWQANGQLAGNFVIPGIRANDGTEFSFWDQFLSAPGGGNFEYDNLPAIGGGIDSEGNTSNNSTAVFVQTGTSTAFVTSSRAIYSFAEPTSFEVRYTPQSANPVNNIIFQTQTGGIRLELDDILLRYTASDNSTFLLTPHFKALDDPQSGGFSERLMSGFQWNTEGLDIGTFELVFAAAEGSMPIWEAQLDVVEGSPFVQELGYVMIPISAPKLRFGAPGAIDKGQAPGEESRFHLPGETLELSGLPEFGFAHAGWIYNQQVIASDMLNLTVGNADFEVTAIFAPADFETWREYFFFHANGLTGQAADNLNEQFSGLAADPDGDGQDNFTEYVFGGDPYTADNDRTQPSVSIVEYEGKMYPAITFQRWAIDEILTDLEYFIEYSTDLASWNGTTTPHSTELQADGTQLVIYRGNTPVSSSPGFLRVRVSFFE